MNQRIGLQTDDEIRRTAAMRKALDALSGGGSTNVYGTNHDTNAAPATTPHPQVIEMNGRLVGTRTPDLHRVNSEAQDAPPCKTEDRSAAKDKT